PRPDRRGSPTAGRSAAPTGVRPCRTGRRRAAPRRRGSGPRRSGRSTANGPRRIPFSGPGDSSTHGDGRTPAPRRPGSRARESAPPAVVRGVRRRLPVRVPRRLRRGALRPAAFAAGLVLVGVEVLGGAVHVVGTGLRGQRV